MWRDKAILLCGPNPKIVLSCRDRHVFLCPDPHVALQKLLCFGNFFASNLKQPNLRNYFQGLTRAQISYFIQVNKKYLDPRSRNPISYQIPRPYSGRWESRLSNPMQGSEAGTLQSPLLLHLEGPNLQTLVRKWRDQYAIHALVSPCWHSCGPALQISRCHAQRPQHCCTATRSASHVAHL